MTVSRSISNSRLIWRCFDPERYIAATLSWVTAEVLMGLLLGAPHLRFGLAVYGCLRFFTWRLSGGAFLWLTLADFSLR